MSSVWQGGNNTTKIDGVRYSVAGTGMKGLGNGFTNKTVGTMFFGTISGGAAAAVSGGNFWQGAVTGLVVSGLNHALHSNPDAKRVKMLNEDLENEFGNGGNDKAPVNQNTLNRLMKLRTFRALNKAAGGKVDVNFVDSSWTEDGASAQFMTLRESQGELYRGSDNGFISVYRSAFSSYKETAGILIHEFGHAISRYRGYFANYYKRYNNWNKAIACDEVFAYGFQDRYGFSFYQPGSKLYLPGLQRAFNKLTN